MEEKLTFGSQEFKMIDRASVAISGINRIISFDDEEFLLESVMGNIHLKGENLELLKLDTTDGNVKIKGKINSFTYLDGKEKTKDESFLTKLFK